MYQDYECISRLSVSNGCLKFHAELNFIVTLGRIAVSVKLKEYAEISQGMSINSFVRRSGEYKWREREREGRRHCCLNSRELPNK